MMILLIVSLIGACLYLLKRLSDAGAENAVLRDQIVSLKKQVVRVRNGPRASAN
jgi:hypothetical protein